MKIDTTKVLVNVTGDPFKDGDKDLTLGKAVAGALSTIKSEGIDGNLKSYVLAQRFYSEEEVDITVEDVVFVKDKIVQSTYFPFIIGQIIKILDA